MSYYKTNEKKVNWNDTEIMNYYNSGFVLTRLGKGEMIQTRSLRIDLENFEFNSENRRIFRKVENLSFEVNALPLTDYSWEIHKMGKDFYTRKFGDQTMSASKIKSMFNDIENENMTHSILYKINEEIVGHTLCYIGEKIMHYAYPFYDLDLDYPNLGMGMMLNAIKYALENDFKHIYLGSVTTAESKYKLQFNNLEWWDTEKQDWSKDLVLLKTLI